MNVARMKLTTALVLAVCSEMALAAPKILDRSVIGRWTFNNGAQSADVSGYGGSTLFLPTSGMSFVSSGSYDDSGYLNITTEGATATATLGGDKSLNDSSYQTVAVRYKSNCSISTSGASGNEKTFIEKLNDHNNWHNLIMRYQGSSSGMFGSTSWRAAIDPGYYSPWWTTSPRPDAGSNDKIMIPASVSGNKLSVGGNVGMSSRNTGYKGAIDEIVVLNRIMSMNEMGRFQASGETYVYSSDLWVGFDAAKGWSSNENDWHPAPGDMPGAAYLLYYEHNMASTGGIFGGSLDKQVSLTIGRATDNTFGTFYQQPGTSSRVQFYDLRLFKGSIVVQGSYLDMLVNLLDVSATSESPFEINVQYKDASYAFYVTESVTGSGVLSKTGPGMLEIQDGYFPAAEGAKIRLVEGSLYSYVLNGYSGGTVYVDQNDLTHKSLVRFVGDDGDYKPSSANKMKLLFCWERPTTRRAVMTLPDDSYTADMFEDTTLYDGCGTRSGLITVENKTVYITPPHPEDLGSVPVLIGK